MANLNAVSPYKLLHIENLSDPRVVELFRNLIRILSRAQLDVALSVNTKSDKLVLTSQITPLPAAGTVYSAIHGLVPPPVTAVLNFICLIAEQGYSVGDTITVHAQWNGVLIIPIDVCVGATTVSAAQAAVYSCALPNKTTGAYFTPTAASWAARFIMQAN